MNNSFGIQYTVALKLYQRFSGYYQLYEIRFMMVANLETWTTSHHVSFLSTIPPHTCYISMSCLMKNGRIMLSYARLSHLLLGEGGSWLPDESLQIVGHMLRQVLIVIQSIKSPDAPGYSYLTNRAKSSLIRYSLLILYLYCKSPLDIRHRIAFQDVPQGSDLSLAHRQ